MKNTVRNTLVPLRLRVSSRARAKAITLISRMDTTAKDTVNWNAWPNWASFSARR